MSQRIPRLEMDELDPRVADMLRPRVERLKYLGEFFKCAGNIPDVLYHFHMMTEALKEVLPTRLTEVVSLTVGKVMNNDYERHQHEQLSLKLGYGEDWVLDVEACAPDDATKMAPEEILTQKYVLAALDNDGVGTAAIFDALAEAVGAEQAMAVIMLTGRYVSHALAINTLELAPPVPSPLKESADA